MGFKLKIINYPESAVWPVTQSTTWQVLIVFPDTMAGWTTPALSISETMEYKGSLPLGYVTLKRVYVDGTVEGAVRRLLSQVTDARIEEGKSYIWDCANQVLTEIQPEVEPEVEPEVGLAIGFIGIAAIIAALAFRRRR